MRPMPKMPMDGPRGPVTPGKPMPSMGGVGPRGPVMPGKPLPPNMGGGPMPRPTSMPMTNVKPMGMKKGGSASSRADGCAMRGKTKGKIV
jgi:hypothetical protein